MALRKPISTDPVYTPGTDPVYTPGTARGAKLAALLVDEGTPLLRKILEEEVQKMNPPSLREQLKKHKGYLRQGKPFVKQGRNYRVNLHPGQKKTLYSPSGDVPDTAQGFDISLLERLLNDLVWLELGRDAPHADHRNSFRQFRNNNYGHISSTDLSEGDFDRLWKKLTEILVALGGDRDKISERLNRSIDPEMEAEYFDLLEKLYKEDMEVKDLILAQGESLRKGQDQLLVQGVSLKSQGDSLKRGQGDLSAQGKRLEKELLAQGESHKKGQEEIMEELRNLPEKVRDAQRQGTDSRNNEDSSSRTGLADAADDVIACLKDLYATEHAHVRPLPWCEDLNLHLEEVYTNLRLQQRDGRGRFQDTGTDVSLADIYNTSKGEDSQGKVRSCVRKIRVEGDPGIGKSCSCQKLAYDWSCGKLKRFKVVFFLEMRHLAGKVKDAIFEQLLPKDTKMTPDQLWSYIKENQDDVLFILDGLDELSQTAREVTDVVDLIQGRILRNCHVLVTSRPYHCVKDLDKCHQFYKIVGYTKENSEEFIRRYFCDLPVPASKLVKQLQSNKNLSELVINPLNTLLICVVWEENNEQLPSSKAELYKMIVLSIAKRFCTKKLLPMEGDTLPRNIEEALRGLEKLSWEGLEQEQLQFNIDEIRKKYDKTADNILNMGLLTRDYSFFRIKRTCYSAFVHKTFQEYMAARYIGGLVMDGSSREEGMKCLRSLVGLTTGIETEPIFKSRRKYREVQDWLLLILVENADPLFDMFAEELNKAKTDWDRDVLSFVCIMWLGKTCVGAKMAKIVAPYLSQDITNFLGDLCKNYDRPIDWFVGLTHVINCQKKFTSSNNPRLTQNLIISYESTCVDSSQQGKLDMLENSLSDYDAIRSVSFIDLDGGRRADKHTSLCTFIPRCGIESVFINMRSLFLGTSYLSLLSWLKQLSEASRVEHVSIHVMSIAGDRDRPDANFSEYDELLAQMIKRQSCLKSIEIRIGTWNRTDPESRGFGNLSATLKSISEHKRLENFQLDHPGSDNLTMTPDTKLEVAGMIDNVQMVRYKRHETFNVTPMVYNLTKCIKKNKVLKTLMLRWRTRNAQHIHFTHKLFYGVCSNQSLSNLCLAIQENRTLKSLVVEGMLSQSKRKANIVAKVIRNKPSNYEELRITMVNCPPFEEFVMFPDRYR